MSSLKTIQCIDCGMEIEWKSNRTRCPNCIMERKRAMQRQRYREKVVITMITNETAEQLMKRVCKRCGNTFTKPRGSTNTLCQPCREENKAEKHIKVESYAPHKFADMLKLRIMVAQAASMDKQYKDIAPLIDNGELPLWTKGEFDAWCRQIKTQKKEGKDNGPVVTIQAARR